MQFVSEVWHPNGEYTRDMDGSVALNCKHSQHESVIFAQVVICLSLTVLDLVWLQSLDDMTEVSVVVVMC